MQTFENFMDKLENFIDDKYAEHKGIPLKDRMPKSVDKTYPKFNQLPNTVLNDEELFRNAVLKIWARKLEEENNKKQDY